MKQPNNFYIDFHILQTVPPSCINRDDTGSPKTAQYGGTTRARVSSQAWKHEMRVYFSNWASFDIGKRTKAIVEEVKNEISILNPSLDNQKAEELAIEALKNAGLKIKSSDKGSGALFFISRKQAKMLAELIIKDEKDKKFYKQALTDNPSFDMALFGRMVADDPSLNYDAAAQVAHVISTHTIRNEYDYFTAVDDCAPEDNAGAGHLGTVEFNSATLYRYATLNVCELAKHISSETPEIVKAFAEAFCYSMPTGKQNTFANRTLPNYVYITIRNDQPVNLVGAFEEPVSANAHGYLITSEERLRKYAEDTYRCFAPKPQKAFGCCFENRFLPEETEFVSLSDLFEKLGQFVADNLQTQGDQL